MWKDFGLGILREFRSESLRFNVIVQDFDILGIIMIPEESLGSYNTNRYPVKLWDFVEMPVTGLVAILFSKAWYLFNCKSL